MIATDNLIEQAERERDAFVERLLQSTAGTFDIFSVYLGDRLGFYRALADGGALTAAELAARTGTVERYAREWLEQQTVTGVLRVENPDDAATARRFRLPAGHAEVLADRDSLNYLAGFARLVVGAVRPLDALQDAFRTGDGVPFAAYGADLREGQADTNRPAFLKQLGTQWLPAMPDVHARLLDADSPARVADIGCGVGWSSIGIARAYPHVRVDGFDLDEASVERAQAIVRAEGLSDRVHIHCRDAGDPDIAGRYDLVTAFECVHDMSDPVGALRTMRRLAGERGTVLVMDERVGDRFTPTGNDVEWLMYGFSVFHCLPVGYTEHPSAATGTVMRADTFRGYAREAGFPAVDILPIENYFFQFYRLHP